MHCTCTCTVISSHNGNSSLQPVPNVQVWTSKPFVQSGLLEPVRQVRPLPNQYFYLTTPIFHYVMYTVIHFVIMFGAMRAAAKHLHHIYKMSVVKIIINKLVYNSY